jgi:hypothetical protein
MDQEESRILEALDLAVRAEAVRPKIEAIVARVEQQLRERLDDVLAWEPIPLDCYTAPLPATIRSSWVFIKIVRGDQHAQVMGPCRPIERQQPPLSMAEPLEQWPVRSCSSIRGLRSSR